MSLTKFKELKQINRIPSNVFTFDLLTKGGIPEGRFTLFYGDKSTSKSTFALRLMKTFLENNPKRYACYVDFEQALDPDWVTNIVGDTDRIYVAQPHYAEDGIAMLQKATSDSSIGFYVIDSLAMVIPMSEAESEADQSFVGHIARTVNLLLRKIVPSVAKHNKEGNPVTVILINQLRHAIGKPSYIPSYTMPGGKFQEALVSMEIRFYQDKVHKVNDIPVKADFCFVIEKNKVGGIPKMAGKYTMALLSSDKYKAGDVIDEPIIIDFLKQYSFLSKNKQGYTLFDVNYATQTEIIEKLRNDITFRQEVVSKIMEVFYAKGLQGL